MGIITEDRGSRALFTALVKHHSEPLPSLPAIPLYALEAAKLWHEGKNTAEIAEALNRPEHEIANQLPAWRLRYRQMRGGGNAAGTI